MIFSSIACLSSIFFLGCSSNNGPTPGALEKTSVSYYNSSSVFVLGGIHQAHEEAEKYTYKRMGEIFDQLHPDVLCVEVEQKFLDDGSDKGMPLDFSKFIVPSARKLGVPIVGIDWWDKTKGIQWEQLQAKAYSDPVISVEIALVGGLFQLLNAYFIEKDFQDINSPEITALWEAKNELKYEVFRQHSEYQFIPKFEQERNGHMVENVLKALVRHPGKRVMVAVGIDHKYFLERELRRHGVRVISVKELDTAWKR